ncbi:MAG: prepilin-type N-terminal cleavage/methylation domain-containing protein [bacterium]
MTNKKGFTLLEVLVTMAILSIVLMLIYTTYANCVSTIEDTQDLIETEQKARLTLDIMVKTIRGAFYEHEDPNLKFIGKDKEINDAGKSYKVDSLSFITANHPFELEDEKHDLIEIGYKLNIAPNNQDKILGVLQIRRDVNIDNDDVEKGGEVFELCDNIEGLNITYYKSADKKWVDEWNSDNENGMPPSAVKLEITLKRRNNMLETYSTLVNLTH